MLLDLRSLVEAFDGAITGSGDLTIQTPELSGIGTVVGTEIIVRGAPIGRPLAQPRRVLTGRGAITLPRPRLQGRGQIVTVGTGALSIPGPAITGTGGLEIRADGQTRLPVAALEGVGVIVPRRLVRVPVTSPARVLTGTASLSLTATHTGTGTIIRPPDAIDRAWLDLQHDDDAAVLMLCGVL